ncbi:MAG TPA: alkaline phosphatase family protein [Myxococcales bacterium]|nr:alkaline phosphatase family protein [Myxococcales bacterium]
MKIAHAFTALALASWAAAGSARAQSTGSDSGGSSGGALPDAGGATGELPDAGGSTGFGSSTSAGTSGAGGATGGGSSGGATASGGSTGAATTSGGGSSTGSPVLGNGGIGAACNTDLDCACGEVCSVQTIPAVCAAGNSGDPGSCTSTCLYEGQSCQNHFCYPPWSYLSVCVSTGGSSGPTGNAGHGSALAPPPPSSGCSSGGGGPALPLALAGLGLLRRRRRRGSSRDRAPALRKALLAVGLLAAGCSSGPQPPQNVIYIDIDDHGLTALWTADAPNIKGLIARGTLAYSRVDVPTHSNHNNYTLLTGQYPDGDDVPANSWLDRSEDFKQPIVLGGSLGLGNYGFWAQNPLRTRSDSVYETSARLGITPYYVGELPPFEVGAGSVHLPLNGELFEGITIDEGLAVALLTGLLDYPQDVAQSYYYDGPGNPGETLAHFDIRDAANIIRASGGNIPRFMFIWAFLALDQDPASHFGPPAQQVITDYDDAVGDILAALQETGTLAQTNIILTLDHGKTPSYYQVNLGIEKGTTDPITGAPETIDGGQLGELIATDGADAGVTLDDFDLINEDGDALVYATVPNAGTAAGAAQQQQVAHGLISLIQSGKLVGVDTTRTITWDGYLGTRRMFDFRNQGPYQADVIVFPQDGWTLNKVDWNNAAPGPFQDHTNQPYSRHGGFSQDELYVPVIMSGPAFKEGQLIPHTVNHSDVAPTAMWALGAGYITTAAGGPIMSAFKGDPGETIAQPADMSTSRTSVLGSSGWLGTLSVAQANQAVIIDVAGLYHDELFNDASLRDVDQPFLDLASQGTVFEHCWDRYRDWPVNEYEMLTGGYPVETPYIPYAEDDPTQQAAPGWGLMQFPAVPGFVADDAGYQVWRAQQSFGVQSIFDGALAIGATSALIGQLDFQDIHLDTSGIALYQQATPDQLPGLVRDFLATNPEALMVVALGGARTADRHSSAARAELASLAQEVEAIADASGQALVVVTSRGATTIDDPGADYYGPQTSRHVPLFFLGPNVPAGVVTSEPATAADIPATVLTGLGAPLRTDFVDGTWPQDPVAPPFSAIGYGSDAGVQPIAQPLPAGAFGGHALVRAFDFTAH